MRFRDTAKLLLKCKLKYYRISECSSQHEHARHVALDISGEQADLQAVARFHLQPLSADALAFHSCRLDQPNMLLILSKTMTVAQ